MPLPTFSIAISAGATRWGFSTLPMFCVPRRRAACREWVRGAGVELQVERRALDAEPSSLNYCSARGTDRAASTSVARSSSCSASSATAQIVSHGSCVGAFRYTRARLLKPLRVLLISPCDRRAVAGSISISRGSRARCIRRQSRSTSSSAAEGVRAAPVAADEADGSVDERQRRLGGSELRRGGSRHR